MENTKENHPGSTKIKIISNLVLGSYFPTPDGNNLNQSAQDNTEISPNSQPATESQNTLEESESSSDTTEVIENINKTADSIDNEQILSKKRKATESEGEETVEFNYLTGAYERVKRKKETSPELRNLLETVQQNNIYKCFDCKFTTNHQVDLKCHAKKHLNSKFVCPNHKIATGDCSKCTYAKCIDNLKVQQQQKIKPNKISSKIKPKDQKFKFNCYHCDYKISSKELLRYHVLKLHYKQNFVCKLHSGKNNKCKKCLYQQILTSIKEEVRICADCGFKTCREATFSRHRIGCNSETTEKEVSDNNDENNLSDSEEEYCPFKQGQISSKTISMNNSSSGSEDQNTDIIIMNDDATKKIVEKQIAIVASPKEETNIEYFNQYANSQDNIDIMNFEANNYDFICYDCPFKAYMEAGYLTNHARTHQESTFTCREHSSFQNFCKRCIYKYTLMSLKLKKIICKYCPKKFDNLDSALIHMRGNCSEQPNSAGYLLCYDCGLKPTSRQELFKHAARHKSNYQCFEHEQPKLKTCSKCLYEFLVKSLYKCFRCDCSKMKSEFELRSHIESKHSNNTVYPQIKCNKHSQANNDCCRQCAMKQICDDVYLQKICPICNTRWTFLKLHINASHRNVEFVCQTHKDKKAYGQCGHCYAEKILESKETIWKCCQCVFRCNSKEEFELHIVVCHSLETFMCPQHSLGDVQTNCDMCAYETIALKLSQ